MDVINNVVYMGSTNLTNRLQDRNRIFATCNHAELVVL